MITIGTDPEFFLRDVRTGMPVPACGRFGGEKGKAKPIDGLPPGFGYQEDNVMLEFNVPPAKDWRGFTRNVAYAMERLGMMIHTLDVNLAIDSSCSRLFPFAALEHPKAQEFGCSPDFNAYMSGAPFPGIDRASITEDIGQWRFAGGHIHLGYNNTAVPHFVVAAFADVFIGLMCAGEDVQGKRRHVYGLPGRFRPTPYGIEYRSLSNYWLFNVDAQVTVARSALRLGKWLESTPVGVMQAVYVRIPWGDVQRCIMDEDSESSGALYNEIIEDIIGGVDRD